MMIGIVDVVVSFCGELKCFMCMVWVLLKVMWVMLLCGFIVVYSVLLVVNCRCVVISFGSCCVLCLLFVSRFCVLVSGEVLCIWLVSYILFCGFLVSVVICEIVMLVFLNVVWLVVCI